MALVLIAPKTRVLTPHKTCQSCLTLLPEFVYRFTLSRLSRSLAPSPSLPPTLSRSKISLNLSHSQPDSPSLCLSHTHLMWSKACVTCAHLTSSLFFFDGCLKRRCSYACHRLYYHRLYYHRLYYHHLYGPAPVHTSTIYLVLYLLQSHASLGASVVGLVCAIICFTS